MVIPNDSAPPTMSGGKAPTLDSPNSSSDLEYVTDSQDEAPPELAIRGAAIGSSGQNASGNRYGSGGDRDMGQRPPQEGAPAPNVVPPRFSKHGHEPLYKNAAPEAGRRTGDNQEPARNDARSERHEQYAGEKRRHHSSDGRRHDSRDERLSSYARAGAQTDAQRPHRSSEGARRSHDVREDRGVERKGDRERRGGGGGENRQHGSSATRPYAAVVNDETDPRYRPQPEHRPSPNDAMPGGPPQEEGPPPQQRQSTSRPHSHPEGHSNQNDNRSGHMARQDRRELEATTAPTPPYSPPPGPDTNEIPEGERAQAPQENHQGTSGKSVFNRIGNIFGGGLSAPSECKCKELQQHIMTMEGRMRHQHQDHQRLNHERDDLTHRLSAAEREILYLNDKLRFAQTELNNVHKELIDAKALSDTRGKELIGAQAFLTKADTISVSEVVGLARTVNNEILQMAASLSDAFTPADHMDTEEDPHQLRAHVEGAIGAELTKLMEDIPDKSTVNPLYAQIVLQALLSRHLADGIDRWWYDWNKIEKVFVGIYDNIRKTENQAVSGRWRAITRARLRPRLDRWIENFVKRLLMIMHLAGWEFTDPELIQTLPDKLRPIFEAAEKLRRAMGEQFTSADIEIAIPAVHVLFNARDMEDDWGDARNPNAVQDVVGGTTGFGLKRRVAHDGSDEIISHEIILPPKVVLLSSLKEIAEPPPPRPKRKKVTGGDGAGASG